MSRMSSDEVNVDLFDEVKHLQKENLVLKNHYDTVVSKLESLLQEAKSDEDKLSKGSMGHTHLAEMSYSRIELQGKIRGLQDAIDIVTHRDYVSVESLTKGLTKEDLANMSLEEIYDLMDKAIKAGNLQFLREL